MMDEYIEDEGKLEEEVVIETPPPSSYLQTGHPFLTLPSPSKGPDSDSFEDVFPFISSDSFLRDISSENDHHHRNSQNNRHTTRYSSSSSSTTSSSKSSSTSSSSTSSSSKHGHSEKMSPNINLFSLFIKQYNKLLSKENDYPSDQTKVNITSPSSKNIEEKEEEEEEEEEEEKEEKNEGVAKKSSNDANNNEESEEKIHHNNDQPPLHENVFKTIMRRLTALERNTTLSFKYLEEQGKIFNQYILYLHKKQQNSLKQLIEDNNMMYDNNLNALVIIFFFFKKKEKKKKINK